MIRIGKSNEEIIKGQLEYLNSKNYLSKRLETIREEGTDMIIFHDGFIPPTMKVAFRGNMVADITYRHDDSEIYDIVINLIRNNMEKKDLV